MSEHSSTARSRRDARQAVLRAVDSGLAHTRAELAKVLGVAPSTASARVQELLDDGALEEYGDGPSNGGRPPRMLRVPSTSGRHLVCDFGSSHVRVGAFDANGALIDVLNRRIDIAQGPRRVIDDLVPLLTAMLEVPGGDPIPLTGVAVGLPGPVDVERGWVDSGARMPGWTRFPVRAVLSEALHVPVVVDNDANLMAVGEHLAHGDIHHSVTVKAGSAIGAGIVIADRLYRGATGAAGDISHAKSAAAGDLVCACGNTGCLDTITSGTALERQYYDNSGESLTLVQIIEAARNSDALSTNLIREAGKRLGEVFCTVVGFANPDAVFIGGSLSTLEPYVAAVRGALYDGCHPLVTRTLIIDRTTTGADAGLLGGMTLLKEALTDGEAERVL